MLACTRDGLTRDIIELHYGMYEKSRYTGLRGFNDFEKIQVCLL